MLCYLLVHISVISVMFHIYPADVWLKPVLFVYVMASFISTATITVISQKTDKPVAYKLTWHGTKKDRDSGRTILPMLTFLNEASCINNEILPSTSLCICNMYADTQFSSSTGCKNDALFCFFTCRILFYFYVM